MFWPKSASKADSREILYNNLKGKIIIFQLLVERVISDWDYVIKIISKSENSTIV